MQSAFAPSEALMQDGEAARASGCLSVLLWPPFSAAFAGILLFYFLVQVPINSAEVELSQHAAPAGAIASFFTPEVQHWEADLVAWSAAQGLDPNLAATVMQIESCGDPLALSPAGAMGLFQVMPYHFAAGESSFEPNTNAIRGLGYLKLSLEQYSEPGMALAAYNGGINGVSRPQHQWAQETRDYKAWGESIYADASAGRRESRRLQEWLAASGASLCAQAAQRVAGD
ncbi:MAG: transglycosylase SLT domain-containing protein [Anaerolineales bacterium]